MIKSFRLLEALGVEAKEQSLANLVTITSLSKPTAHRTLQILVGLGYIERGNGGTYCLSDRLKRVVLGQGYHRLYAAAQPVMRRLHEATSETVNLGVIQGDFLNCLITLESLHALRFVGRRSTDPLHCSALGRVILAHLGRDRREYFLCRPLSKQTPFTTVDPKVLRKMLDDVKLCGWAFEENEADVGVACFAAPVFDCDDVAAAISVSVPTARVSSALRKKLTSSVCDAASHITRSLNEMGN